jgi:hypothetical protein
VARGVEATSLRGILDSELVMAHTRSYATQYDVMHGGGPVRQYVWKPSPDLITNLLMHDAPFLYPREDILLRMPFVGFRENILR